jgi:hypothetical protein
MSITGNDLIEATLDFLTNASREEVNRLSSSINSTATQFNVDFALGGIQIGALLDIDLEVMRVLNVDGTSKSVTVARGQRGSTAASHTGGTLIQVNPRYSRWSIWRALNDEIASLAGAGLFQMKTLDVTYNPSISGYDLTGVTSAEDIYTVRYKVPGSTKEWGTLERSDWSFDPLAPTSDFPSGFALFVHCGGYSGQPLRVAYKAPFTQLSSPSDVVETVTGIPVSMNDILVLGSAIRLHVGREAGRGAYETQAEPRRAEEVPVGSQVSAVTAWQRLRAARIDEERRRLQRRYPIRR